MAPYAVAQQHQHPQSALIEGKYTVDTIVRAARKLEERRTASTQILDTRKEAAYPTFTSNELTHGKLLGKGFFCEVSEITHVELMSSERSLPLPSWPRDEQGITRWVHDRPFMQAHCRRNDRDCRYALKRLQRTTRERTAVEFMNGLVDLAIEARFLAVLQHPHIVQLRAVGRHGAFSAREHFFLVLDRLYDTMSERIVLWKQQRPNVLQRKKRKESWMTRLMAAHGLGSAMAYLHEKHIIYRDLKPDNIGFDVRDTVKLFDFGLSREFDPTKANALGQYLLTENTGSPRYMAPEVAFGQPYNENADVYSFSLLLWHMIKLEAPFRKFRLPELKQKVYKEGLRPKCDGISRAVTKLLHDAWGHPLHRPSMQEVVQELEVQAGISPVDEEEADRGPGMTPSLLSALQLGYPGAVAAAAAVQGRTEAATAAATATTVIPEEEELDPDFSADLSMYYRPDAPSALEEIHQQSLPLEKEEKKEDKPLKAAPGKNSVESRKPPDPLSELRFEI